MEIDQITEIENKYTGRRGEPALGEAYGHLKDRWDAGHRDRETCFRFLFLCWFCCAEPTWLTGLPEDEGSSARFRAVFEHMRSGNLSEPEFLFVVGYMATQFPWCCGEVTQWEAIGRNCLARFRLIGVGIAPELFEGRGAYGHYFSHIVKAGWLEQVDS